MRRMKLNSLVIGCFAILGLTLFSCSDDSKYARLNVRLTDAPGDYEEVWINIEGVKVHTDEGEQESGWKSLDVNAGTYNLLELTNGLDTLLGTIELPAGRISQIRLLLGEGNVVKIGGETFDLKTPSAQQSGLKFNVHADLVEGITYTMLLDFDVARSIVETGSGKYILKPVIRAITEATTGAIDGTVSNPASTPAVYAIIGSDTLGTSFANEAGNFMIKGLAAGTYKISFSPAEGFTITDIEGVEVSVGAVTHLGEITVVE